MADRELSKLGKYLVHIADRYEDFQEANHAVSFIVYVHEQCSLLHAAMEERSEVPSSAVTFS